jgi:hypothetical protein
MSAPTQVPDTIHELAADAQTTPQMMRALWQLAADACKNMQKGVSLYLVCAKVQPCFSNKYNILQTYNIIYSSHTQPSIASFIQSPGFSHRPLSRHGTKIIQPKIPQQINGPLRRLQGRL